MPQHVSSKWLKTKVLLGSKQLRAYVPVTKQMTSESVRAMLNRFGMVYVKPNVGTFGNGVMRVEWNRSHKRPYAFQSGVRRRTFDSYEAMYQALHAAKLKKRYLVQQGIPLLKTQGRPFDIRVMVQQSPKQKWETTGVIARVAAPKKIVTNYHNGGTPMSVHQVLSRLKPKRSQADILRKLDAIGIDASRCLQQRFPGIKEIGLDVGLDNKYKPWILEANTSPDPYIFNQLKDKSMYKKVYRYAVAYGKIRTKRKK